jgi:hypothetical protein
MIGFVSVAILLNTIFSWNCVVPTSVLEHDFSSVGTGIMNTTVKPNIKPQPILAFPHATDSCGVWSARGLLEAGSRTSYRTSDVGDGIMKTKWRHERSGAPSANGDIESVVYYRNSLSKDCANIKDHVLDQLVDWKTLLCFPRESVDGDGDASTVAINLIGNNWGDMIGNLNLWHFYTSIFRLWTSLSIGAYAWSLTHQLTLTEPLWVVLVIPNSAWRFYRLDQAVLFSSPENLWRFGSESKGSSRNAFEALQAIHDLFQGRLLIAAQDCTAKQLQNALIESRAPTQVKIWIDPPRDGLMWDVAWDRSLSGQLMRSNCRNSLLQQFRRNLLYSEKEESDAFLPSPIAKHVCFVSRQYRGRPDDFGQETEKLRNLEAGFLLELLGRLGSPILLTPYTALRYPNSSSTSPEGLFMDKTSIRGQLRFVYDECALLIGVHGAGLTNALGLRPGSAVVELQTRTGTYQYFRNVAALLDDVDYKLVRVLGRKGSGDEVDMYAKGENLENLHQLIETKLEQSIERQRRIVAGN